MMSVTYLSLGTRPPLAITEVLRNPLNKPMAPCDVSRTICDAYGTPFAT